MDEKKNTYRGFTEAQKRANEKYQAKFELLRVRVLPDEKEAIQTAATAAGESMNEFIRGAVWARMKR